MGWSFWGDGDFETMGGGRGSFRTRDWVVRGSWNIHLAPRSLWRRVETGELYILSASRKPTDRNHLEAGGIAPGGMQKRCGGRVGMYRFHRVWHCGTTSPPFDGGSRRNMIPDIKTTQSILRIIIIFILNRSIRQHMRNIQVNWNSRIHKRQLCMSKDTLKTRRAGRTD